ncbi:hypothetical protein C8Q75DRAFT_298118 [Abortiporus biennis]|nr:hypothetical protein C8Q75DRAFT_298118 [Abortiporus biennis]
MRSPVITLSLVAAAVISPTVTSAAPIDAPSHGSVTPTSFYHTPAGGNVASPSSGLVSRSFSPTSLVNEIFARALPGGQKNSSSSQWDVSNPKKYWRRALQAIYRRMDDSQTMGGNAHTGNTGDVNGGAVNNPDTTMNQGMPVILNMSSNNAGVGGHSNSGCGVSGKSSSRGTGGNASSGNSGDAIGGDVNGSPSGMFNYDSNNAGGAGQSETGCAYGGDSNEKTA